MQTKHKGGNDYPVSQGPNQDRHRNHHRTSNKAMNSGLKATRNHSMTKEQTAFICDLSTQRIFIDITALSIPRIIQRHH
jgi:hypothetical protein